MLPEQQAEKQTMRADLLVGGLSFVVGLGAVLLIPREVAQNGLAEFGDVRSPAFFPVTAALFLMLLSGALMLRALRARALSGAATPGRARPSLKMLAVGGALGLAGLAIFWLGFLITAALLVAGLSYIFGERRILRILALAVCVPVGIQILFREILNVLLPLGVW